MGLPLPNCPLVVPLVYMVEQVLLKHPAPPLDDVHQRVLKGSEVKLEPAAEDPLILRLAHPYVQGFKQVDLKWRTLH